MCSTHSLCSSHPCNCTGGGSATISRQAVASLCHATSPTLSDGASNTCAAFQASRLGGLGLVEQCSAAKLPAWGDEVSSASHCPPLAQGTEIDNKRDLAEGPTVGNKRAIPSANNPSKSKQSWLATHMPCIGLLRRHRCSTKSCRRAWTRRRSG